MWWRIKLKIAIVTHFPDDPKAPNGGVEAVSVNLVRALSEFDDLQIEVITSRRSCTESTKEQWGEVVIHRLGWAGGSVLLVNMHVLQSFQISQDNLFLLIAHFVAGHPAFNYKGSGEFRTKKTVEELQAGIEDNPYLEGLKFDFDAYAEDDKSRLTDNLFCSTIAIFTASFQSEIRDITSLKASSTLICSTNSLSISNIFITNTDNFIYLLNFGCRIMRFLHNRFARLIGIAE